MGRDAVAHVLDVEVPTKMYCPPRTEIEETEPCTDVDLSTLNVSGLRHAIVPSPHPASSSPAARTAQQVSGRLQSALSLSHASASAREGKARRGKAELRRTGCECQRLDTE